ncbi:MAG TPA: hypothetical protein VGX68_26545 [Thermoanaerobaculia bacterium]|jgi:hypothetical protein|nr:hypothetical protein [Thermoanaerobaculia bacterium]
MNFKKTHWLRSILFSGAGLLALPAFAIPHEAALGNQGELYLVKSGNYGVLFPGGKEADESSIVLALEITRPGEPARRVLVPDTKDKDLESSPAVIFEADSETVFLVWESRLSNRSVLRLTSFDGTHWARSIEVTANSYSPKTSPQLATTRDSYPETDAEGKPTLKHRTVLHLTWTEETAADLYEAFYTPVILDDGIYIGWNPIFSLNDFELSEGKAGYAVAPELVRSPTVQAGHDGRSLLVTFTSALTGHLATLEIDVLPTQLRQLADKARAYIIDLGAHQKPDLPSVAAKARDFLLTSAAVDFQSEVARSMADLLQTYILSQGFSQVVDDLKPLADKARAYIIDLGAKFSGRVLKPAPGEAKSLAQILQIAPRLDGMPENPPTHLLQVRTVSSRPAPAIGSGTVRVFVSETGASALVSWTGKDRVFYRDSQGDGWSGVRELKLNDNIDLNKAYEVLNQRVQNR